MSDLPSNSFAEPPAQRTVAIADGNRLSIAHLLLWMTATAAVMALFQPSRVVREAAGGKQVVEATSQQGDAVVLTIVGPALGAGVAAVILCLWRLVTRRFGFPTQPGHWLLFTIGGCFIVPLLLSTLLNEYDVGIGLLGFLLSAAALTTVAAWRIQSPTYWKVAFSLGAGGFNAFALFSLAASVFHDPLAAR